VLNIKRIPKVNESVSEERPQKITKVAIGLPGGLSLNSEENFQYQTKPYCFDCDMELNPLFEPVASSVNSILSAHSAGKQEDIKAWENLIVPCEETLTLLQVNDVVKLKKKSLSNCGDCENTSNLWLCLTCGHLGCGRKNYDGTGGNGHALEHSNRFHHFVVCKMGTITPEGTADIHCYKCDDLRIDPYLLEHLSTFGINISTQQKTEKSLSEMELEQNLNLDLGKTLEGNVELEKIYGPGYTGLKNLGNTCYMASVLQVMFGIPDFSRRYFPLDKNHILTCQNPPHSCYHCQMGKLADGLLSGFYSQPKKSDDSNNEDEEGISPRMFKSFFCKGHPEFSTIKQQDAFEFFQFFLKTVQQRERSTGEDPTKIFEYSLQQKLKCENCNRVRYSSVKQTDLSLPIPTEFADPPIKIVDGEKESERATRESLSKVSFNVCLDSFLADEFFEFNCPHCNKKSKAIKNYRFLSFPRYLAVNMRRFVFEEWVPHKLSIKVEVPDIIDLEKGKGFGKQSGEVLLEESEDVPQINEQDVKILMDMGFPRLRCEKAILASGNRGSELATVWLFDHMDDPELDTPISKKVSTSHIDVISQELVQQLSEMGFTVGQAKKALKETEGNMERAVEWLFSHADEPCEEAQVKQETAMEIEHGSTSTHYKLIGFLVHLGSSVHSGHYVAYLLKENQWIQFNDRKVSKSVTPPTGAAYMYFFERI